MSFNFNFDDDDELPFDFNEIMKMIQNMQQDILEQLRAQGIDPADLARNLSNPNAKRMGFSIHMGPDGKPHIQPLNNENMPFDFGEQKQSHNGFEEPFVDIFYSEEAGYQIIAELTGIENPEMVHLGLTDDQSLRLHAETGPFKYRTEIDLDHEINPDTMSYELRNGVLEITMKAV